MSTCITVEFYDRWSNSNEGSLLRARLEHFSKGSLQSIGMDLERRLVDIRDAIKQAGRGNGWVSQEVAGLMVKLSAQDDGSGGIPTFRPCLEIDRGCEYVWRIFLGPKGSEYDMRCLATDYITRDLVLMMMEVDWKAGERV